MIGLPGESGVAEQHAAADPTELADARRTIENLRIALKTSRRIGIAMGIVMARYKVPEPQAFELLAAVSQNENRKIRDLADDIILTGTIESIRTAPTT